MWYNHCIEAKMTKEEKSTAGVPNKLGSSKISDVRNDVIDGYRKPLHALLRPIAVYTFFSKVLDILSLFPFFSILDM